jgi:hypothetical protein
MVHTVQETAAGRVRQTRRAPGNIGPNDPALRYLWKVGSTPTVWAHRRRLGVGPKQRSCWRARLAKPQRCAAESTVGRARHHREPPESYLPETEVILARRPDMWFDASSSKDPPMQKSPMFGIASQLTRHCVTPACSAGRRDMVSVTYLSGVLLSHPGGALPPSPREVTGGNGGNAANVIFLRHPPATPSKG